MNTHVQDAASGPGWLILLVVWLFFAFLLAFGLGSLNVPRMWQLTMRGQKTGGVVVSTEPNNHQTVRYTYRVAGRDFASSTEGGAGVGNPSFDRLVAGTAVNVYFDPEDPRVAGLGEPRAKLENEIISVGVASLLIPTLFVLRWRSLSRVRQARKGAQA